MSITTSNVPDDCGPSLAKKLTDLFATADSRTADCDTILAVDHNSRTNSFFSITEFEGDDQDHPQAPATNYGRRWRVLRWVLRASLAFRFVRSQPIENLDLIKDYVQQPKRQLMRLEWVRERLTPPNSGLDVQPPRPGHPEVDELAEGIKYNFSLFALARSGDKTDLEKLTALIHADPRL